MQILRRVTCASVALGETALCHCSVACRGVVHVQQAAVEVATHASLARRYHSLMDLQMESISQFVWALEAAAEEVAVS